MVGLLLLAAGNVPRNSSSEAARIGSSPPGATEGAGGRRTRLLYVILASVIIVVVVVAGLDFVGLFSRGSGDGSTTLAKKGTVDLIPAENFNAIVFEAKSASVISGTIAIIYVLDVYEMNSSEFSHLVRLNNVSGYQWTSGQLQNTSGYGLEVHAAPGMDYLVFYNPAPIEALLGYSTNLVLQPS